jgi:hypothetical protein
MGLKSITLFSSRVFFLKTLALSYYCTYVPDPVPLPAARPIYGCPPPA